MFNLGMCRKERKGMSAPGPSRHKSMSALMSAIGGKADIEHGLIALATDGGGVERAADVLHRARADIELGCSLAHAHAALHRLPDGLFCLGGYPGPPELHARILGPR